MDASVVISLLSQATMLMGNFPRLLMIAGTLWRASLRSVCYNSLERLIVELTPSQNLELAWRMILLFFEFPPSFIVQFLHSDKLGLTQDHVCNMEVATT